jgi:glucose-1-phosphatase
MPITTILFDLGKTLLDFSFDRIINQLTVSSGRPADEVRSLLFDRYAAYGRGEMDGHQWREFIAETFSLDMPHDEFRTFWGDIFVPIDGMFDLAQRTRTHYRQYLLSNTDDIHLPFCLERFAGHFDGLLDGMILSYEAGANKPDPAIYRYGIDRFKLVPEQCVFIDDMRENIEGAEAFGIHGIVIESPEQVESELNRMGVRTR